MSELTELYNPANAKALKPEEINAMQSLTRDQLEELAKAYPNQPRGNNYLILINTSLPMDKQVYQLSTWQNLANLRRLNQDQFVAYTFQSIFDTNATLQSASQPTQTSKVVDLSAQDLQGVEGFKPSDVKTAPIISTEGPTPDKLLSTESTEAGSNIGETGSAVEYDQSNPEVKAKLDEFNEQKTKLEQLITDKAHHMTIKAQEAKTQEALEKLKASESQAKQ